MHVEQPVAVLEELLAARGEQLRRTAVLLTGSHDEGEDLLQAALERVFRRWRTVSGDPEGYLRRTMYNLAADGWRRQRAWRARIDLLRHAEAAPDDTRVVDDRDHIIRLLRELPPRQRTATRPISARSCRSKSALMALSLSSAPSRLWCGR